jgi:hypothetical protein
MRCPFDAGGERSVSFAYWPMTPVFLAIDLDGVQVGVLSADPQSYRFPNDVPMVEGEKTPPKVNFYGRGRGVLFHAYSPKGGEKTSFGDPASWAWDKDQIGRAVLNPRRRPEYEKRLFAFEAGRDAKQPPHRVKLVHNPETGRVALLVDDREVLAETSDRWKTGAFKQTGRIQILSYTTCAIDGLEISGRISREWLDEMKAKNEKRPTSGTSAPAVPRAPK